MRPSGTIVRRAMTIKLALIGRSGSTELAEVLALLQNSFLEPEQTRGKKGEGPGLDGRL